jgi:DNA-binding Lrp family transcriptional regulator
LIEIDARDIDILNVLQAEGRITNRDLAIRVGLSPSACLSRVKRLEKARVIRSYHARLELARVARSIQCIAMVKLARHGSGAFQAFAGTARSLPEVIEVLMLSGQYDFMIRVVCADIGRYNAISDRLLARDAGVESISSYVVMEETKPLSGVPLAALCGVSGDGI